jgi:uncharacterized membrane protein required for colicin V production
MNLLDVSLLILLLVFMLLGWKIRSIRLLALVAAVFLGTWAGSHFHARLLAGFQEHVSHRAAVVLAWVTPCLIAGILVLLLGFAVSAALSVVALGWLDRALGAVLAGTALLLIIALGLARLQTSPPPLLKPSLEHSLLAKPLLQTFRPLLRAGQNWWPALEKSLKP